MGFEPTLNGFADRSPDQRSTDAYWLQRQESNLLFPENESGDLPIVLSAIMIVASTLFPATI